MAYPNYSTTSSYQPQTQIPDALTEGSRFGQAAGNIIGGFSRAYDNQKAEQNRNKAAQLIAEYNDPESKIFTGLVGSLRTLRLSQLLLPLDPALSARYETRAAEERTRDYGAAGVESEDKSEAQISDLDTKIAEIEAVLAERSDAKVAPLAIKDVPVASNPDVAPAPKEGLTRGTLVSHSVESDGDPAGYPFRNEIPDLVYPMVSEPDATYKFWDHPEYGTGANTKYDLEMRPAPGAGAPKSPLWELPAPRTILPRGGRNITMLGDIYNNRGRR